MSEVNAAIKEVFDLRVCRITCMIGSKVAWEAKKPNEKTTAQVLLISLKKKI